VVEGDRAAVRVEQGGVGTDLREPGERHRGARLVDLEDAEVRQGDAGLLQGLPVAGIGAVSTMTGALAARTAVWTLAIEVRTSSQALSLGAADPSLIYELLPTWITPSGLKAGLSLARPSTVPPPADTLVGVGDGAVLQLDRGDLRGERRLGSRCASTITSSASWARKYYVGHLTAVIAPDGDNARAFRSMMRAHRFDLIRRPIARIYDYLLGGTDNFAADRAAAEEVLQFMPEILDTVRGNRQFLRRAVGFLRDAGIRQFIDIGSGLPSSPNVHEIAQADHPGHAWCTWTMIRWCSRAPSP
jgi:hypothetical protein